LVESSAPGSSTFAQISSSCSRGAVAPRISSNPAATMSAARVSSAAPIPAAWVCNRSPWSSAASISPEATAFGTADRITRSRNRRSRSSANRFGSCPVSITFSTVSNTARLSCAANPSTHASSSESGVNPSSATASSYVTPSGPAPPISWSSTLSESRTDPAPARTTNGSAAGAMATPSASHSVAM
jgi:hypothetical protein